MNKAFFSGMAAVALPLAMQAGTPMVYTTPGKGMAPPPPAPAPVYGVGPYVALQGGANVYQSYEDTVRLNSGGNSYALEAKERVGGFGGVKFGYAWDGEVVRPAVELDAFYNGADSKLVLRENGREIANESARFDTGAFLANGLLRFNSERFQPYMGVGVGVWVGQVNDTRFTVTGGESVRISNNDTNADLAAQALGGFDFFAADRISIFVEYKFLNYFGVDAPQFNDPVHQHLVGGGVRFFF